MMGGVAWAQYAVHCVILSLLSIGGINTVIPELHRFVVDVHPWLTDQQFADLFAIAQAAPGPNFFVFCLVGWQIAGFLGAAVGVIALCAPCCLLTFITTRLWQRFHETLARRALQGGLAPLAVGLVLATGYVLSRAAIHGWATAAITLATIVLTLVTRIHPLWLFAVGGVFGVLGFA